MIDLPTIPALAEAACVNYPAEWWYPAVRVGRGGGLPKDALVAVEICQTCPVREDCLRQADDHGIWGGLTPNERKALT